MFNLASNITKLRKFSKNSAGRFKRSKKGSVTVSFAIMAIPFLMAGTMVVDYSNAIRTKAVLQAAADAAVLAAATAIASGQDDQNKTKIALEQFAANLPDRIKRNFIGEPKTVINLPSKEVTLTATIDTKAYFGSLLRDVISLKVVSTAIVNNGTPICMLALNPSVEKAIYLNGTADVVASGCAVHVNSDHSQALVEDGTGLATSEQFCVRGGYEGTGFSPLPAKGCFKEEDPLATKMATAWATVDTTCTVNHKTIIKSDTTLDPGVYCGGVDIKSGTLTLKEGGIYVFRDGPLAISAHGTLRGVKTTILFTGDSSTRLTTQGGANIDISAQTDGPFSGVAIAMHESVTPDKVNLVTGGGYMSIDGIVYFPKQHLSIRGNGVIGEDTDQFAIIADTITVKGTGLLTIKITAENESFSHLPELPKSLEHVALVK